MIETPKGILRLVALSLLSRSSLSGRDLSEQLSIMSSGLWKPSPGSIYPILSSLLNEGMIAEVPRKQGNVRRYIVTSKGKQELSKLQKEAEESIVRQLGLLSLAAEIIGNEDLKKRIQSIL